MRPSNSILVFTLIASLFTSINLQAQTLASAETARTTMIEHVVKERPVLVELLTMAGLVPVLSSDGPYTLFAPPESELNALKGQSAEQIKLVLAGHIIKGKYNEKDLKDGAKLETLNGQSINICRKKNTLINGVTIAKADTEFRNGVIHSISSAFTY